MTIDLEAIEALDDSWHKWAKGRAVTEHTTVEEIRNREEHQWAKHRHALIAEVKRLRNYIRNEAVLWHEYSENNHKGNFDTCSDEVCVEAKHALGEAQ